MPKHALFFRQQRLHSINMQLHQLPESLSKKLLNIKDMDGNNLALYESDYNIVMCYLKKHQLNSATLSRLEMLKIIKETEVKVVKYFSSENLKKLKLDVNKSHFNCDGNIVTVLGMPLEKDEVQNCVVMLNDTDSSIYIHPKTRSVSGDIKNAVFSNKIEERDGLIGVNHSSLSEGKRVKFAGSFIHTRKYGWMLDNTSGHYGTYCYQIPFFLKTLQEKGCDIKDLTVKLCIVNDAKQHTRAKKNYIIRYENALELLDRVNKSKESIAMRIASSKVR